MFDATVVNGHLIFGTISPSDKHIGLVLRLRRYRKRDPMLQARSDDETRALRMRRARLAASVSTG